MATTTTTTTTATTTSISLPAPRRKARVKEVPGAAVPIPSALSHPPCTHYEAIYSQGYITIRDPKQAAALWHNGYYGHGLDKDCGGGRGGGGGGGGGGAQRGRKKWRLVEADGLRNGKWFKKMHEKGRQRREFKGGGVEGEEMEVNSGKDEKNWEEQEKERRNEEDVEMEELKEEKREERSITKLKNEEEAEKESGNMREGERGGRKNEMGEESDLEPWRTMLVLSADQEANPDHHDPYACLTLLPEEALFLSYALGCLVLIFEELPAPSERHGRKRPLRQEPSTHEMTIDEMWRAFVQDDPAFPVKYAAYHHFRTEGWVVKAGLKYGVDYVLYPVGPPFYHSQYAVRVHCLWADTLALDRSLPGHEMTWTTIATTERLTNHINKTPVMCFVLRPRSVTDQRLTLIECIKELKIQTVVLGRWNPSDGSG